MRKRKMIFLSYRRDDNPGYVRQLQEDLQRYFGDTSVFRDVEAIAGGSQWRDELDEGLAKSAALVLVIGPRWEQIWNEREDKHNDYIVYELNKAREMGVPIIPVTINGTVLSKGIELGPISWLMDKQHYDISDRQSRWDTDVGGLVDILDREKGLTKRRQKPKKSRFRYALVPLFFGVAALSGYLALIGSEPIDTEPYEPPIAGTSTLTTPVATATPGAATPVTLEGSGEATASVQTAFAAPEQEISIAPQVQTVPESAAAMPDISGLWMDDEGSVVEVSEVIDGNFMFGNLEAVGYGWFIENMPRKIKVQVDGVGHGEYSVTSDDERMMGWFYLTATNETLYSTLWRVE